MTCLHCGGTIGILGSCSDCGAVPFLRTGPVQRPTFDQSLDAEPNDDRS